LQPPELTLCFALFPAGGLRATLMTQVALIGTIKRFAAKAVAPGGTPSLGPLKNLTCLAARLFVKAHQYEKQANKTKKSFV
jgi:hypothetical protein